MKLSFAPFGCGSAIALCLTGFALAAHAASSTPARPTPAAPGADLTNAVVEIPKSLFTVPHSPEEGKDPFYPASTRLFVVSGKTNGTNIVAAPIPQPQVELLLKGFSGPAKQRLAIINNRTFSAGESGEVRSGVSKVRVRCVQINDDSVIIETNGQRRVLHMRNGF